MIHGLIKSAIRSFLAAKAFTAQVIGNEALTWSQRIAVALVVIGYSSLASAAGTITSVYVDETVSAGNQRVATVYYSGNTKYYLYCQYKYSTSSSWITFASASNYKSSGTCVRPINVGQTANFRLSMCNKSSTGGATGCTYSSTVTKVVETTSKPEIREFNQSTVTINEDNAAVIRFQVGGYETPKENLVFSHPAGGSTFKSSLNYTWADEPNNYKTLTIRPQANDYGKITQTILVRDEYGQGDSRTFTFEVLPVNDTPTISDIAPRAINEDANTGDITFTVDDVDTAASSLTVTATSSNTALVPNSNITLGVKDSTYKARTIRVTPLPNKSGTSTITVKVSDGSITKTDTFVVTVTPVNDLPTITNLTNRTIDEDQSTGVISFTVADIDNAATSLLVSAVSSNSALVGSGNIVLGRTTDSIRTIKVTPIANKFGVTTISVRVSDGGATVTNTFVLTVNSVSDTPTIANIPDQTINEDSSTDVISFTVSDVDTSAGVLEVSATSSNTALIPSDGVVLGKETDSIRTIKVIPAANKSGNATITVRVTDGDNSATDSFVVTVNRLNDAPIISSVGSISTSEDSLSPYTDITLSDVDGDSLSLSVGTVTNAALIGQVQFENTQLSSGSVKGRVRIMPALNAAGSGTIEVKVSDGDLVAKKLINFTITPVNDAPVIGVINDQSTILGAGDTSVSYSLTDVDSTLSAGSISVTSSNSLLVDPSRIAVTLQDGTGKLVISPKGGQTGEAIIYVSVTDGNKAAARSFTYSVKGVEGLPNFDYDLNDTALLPDPDEVGELVAITNGMVSVNQGVANYAVNLDLPPAVRDFKPDLSFVYSSSSSAGGTLGVGWSLSSSSEITRCAPISVHPSAVVTYTEKDRFCLDGQRIYRNELGTPVDDHGTVMRDEWDGYEFDGNISFHTEIDGMGRITSNSDTTEFVIEGAGGETLTYGGDSAVHNSLVKLAFGGEAVIKSWKLRKVEDRYGNVYEYFYNVDAATGENYLAKIFYAPGALVVFNYEEKEKDFIWGYERGANKFERTKLLRSVSTYIGVDSPASSANGTPVKEFDLAYEFSPTTDRYRIKTITECGFDDGVKACARPLTFGWTDGNLGFGEEEEFIDCETGGNIIAKRFVDFNNDGYTDILGVARIAIKNVESVASGSVCYDTPDWLVFPGNASDWQSVTPFRSDEGMAIVATNQYKKYLKTLKFDFSREVAIAESWDGGVLINTSFSGNTGEFTYPYVYDYDGDGIDEVKHFGAMLSNPSLLFSDIEEPHFEDLNGDGDRDALMIRVPTDDNPDKDRAYLRMFYGLGNHKLTTAANGLDEQEFRMGITNFNNPSGYDFGPRFAIASSRRAIVDLNGDGNSDILYKSGGKVYVRIMQRDFTFGEEVEANITPNTTDGFVMHGYDVNRDGLNDIVYCGGAVKYASAERSGTGEVNFAFKSGPSSPVGRPCSNYASSYEMQPLRGDFNDDGELDIIINGVSGLPANVGSPDVLQSITDGFGKKVELSYDNLTPNIYTPATVVEYPNTHAARNYRVVSELRADTGVGDGDSDDSWIITRYSYQGAKYDMVTRGFLGFEAVISEDMSKNTVTKSTYSQEFPFIRRVLVETVKTSGGALLSKDEYEWNHVSSVQNGVLPYVQYERHTQYALNGIYSGPSLASKLVERKNVDGYGNVGEEITQIGRGVMDVFPPAVYYQTSYTHVIKEFQNNDASWLLGFVERATITRSKTEGAEESHVEVTTAEPEPGTLDVAVLTRYVDTAKEHVTTTLRNSEGVVTNVTTSAKDYNGVDALAERTVTFSGFEDSIYPAQIENAKDQKMAQLYDKRFGIVSKKTEPNGNVSEFEFDALGRQSRVTDLQGSSSSNHAFYCGSTRALACPANAVYGTASFVTNVNQEGAFGAPVTVEYFDRMQRKVRSEVYSFTGYEQKVDFEYYPDGNLKRSSEPYIGAAANYWTEYSEYDVRDRPGLIVKPDGGEIVYQYDQHAGGSGLSVNTESVTVETPNGTEVRNKYTHVNASGQVSKVIDDEGMSVTYFYSPLGSLERTVVNDDPATAIDIEYDVAGNKTFMVDPDAGVISYDYDGYGQMRVQTWAPETDKQKSITYTYDKLGRKVTRVDAGGSTPASYVWTWDTRKDGLLSTVSGNGYQSNYFYNGNNQLQQQSTQLQGLTEKSFQFIYDDFGRPVVETYPSGLTLEHEYHTDGTRVRTRNQSDGKVLWALSEVIDDRGVPVQQVYGNGIVTTRRYNQTNGLLSSIVTGNARASGGVLAVNGNIQNLQYQFDSIGNLYARKSMRTDTNGASLEYLQETFTYDTLNRLESSEVSSGGIVQYGKSFGYDDFGNLIEKTGVSGIAYGRVNGAGIHGITAANDTSYHYDAYGNIERRESAASGTDVMEYDAFNKPTRIGTRYFSYGPEHMRYKQVSSNKTTYYFAGGLYEVAVANGVATEKSYVGDYLVETKREDEAQLTFLHRDHLGSVDATTDVAGVYLGRMSFSAWGERRQAVWGEGEPDVADLASVTSRGFTGHEMLDDVNLVHMNGRVYDPVVGRFLSPDLFVQSPYNTQSFNRYSYVFNNPLSMVDPSGYLGEMDIMHATLEARHAGAAWSMTMSSVNSGIAGMDAVKLDRALRKAAIENGTASSPAESSAKSVTPAPEESDTTAEVKANSGGGGGGSGASEHKGNLDSSSPVKGQFAKDFEWAKGRLVAKGLLPADVANNPELLVDMTDSVGLIPSGTTEGSVTVMSDLAAADLLVESGNWQYVDGSERGGVMTIYRHGALPSASRHMARFGSTSLTGRQNLIETMHHEYLHRIGVTSHTSDSLGWGIRVRSDLGGWLLSE